MKKIVASLLVLAFLCSAALASSEEAGPKGIHEAGTGIENPEIKEEVQGTGQGLEDVEEVVVVEEEEVVAEPEAEVDEEAAPEPIAVAAEEEKETEAETEPEKQPGFEALFAATGLLAAALILRLRT